MIPDQKIHWGGMQVIADVEKTGQRRHRLSGFYVVDISRILPHGKAHISGRHTFLLTKLRQTQGKIFFIHTYPQSCGQQIKPAARLILL